MFRNSIVPKQLNNQESIPVTSCNVPEAFWTYCQTLVLRRNYEHRTTITDKLQEKIHMEFEFEFELRK